MFKGVIFDFNGTIFWDTPLHNKAWDIYLEQFDVRLSDKEKHLKLHGKNNNQLITDLFNADLTDQQIDTIAREKELLYQQLVKKNQLQLADGVTEIFERLKQLGIAFTIVTASDKLNVDFFFDHLDLHRWFDRDKVVFADGSLKPKPFPDMFLKGMENMHVKPHETIIFEDSETGLISAKEAKPGKIIIVNSNNMDYSSWPFKVINSFHELGDNWLSEA